jgi:PAS domain S-box-containing protein
VLFNQAAEKMFGCSAEEALGRPIDRFIPQQHREAHHRHIRQFAKAGITSRKMGALGTITGLRSTGEEFPIEAAISKVSVEGAQLFTVILRDVTEWKRVEQLVRQSEERYRRLVAVSPDALLINRGDRVIFVNDRGVRLFGAVRAEEILGKSPFELFHPDCHPLIRARVHSLLEDEKTVPLVEEKILRLDGTTVDVEVSAARFMDEEGVAILVVLRDITERKRAVEALEESEERFRQMAETVNDVMWIIEPDPERVLYVSPAYERLWGRKAEDLYRDPRLWIADIHPDDRPRVQGVFEQWLKAQGPTGLDVEFRIVRPDGTIRWIHVRGALIRDQDNRVYRANGIAVDLTGRKQLEEQLRKTERLAELGTLASGMAHEIGTPMNVILGRAEYLMERVKDEPIRKGLQTIVSQVERITRVMNQLLAFARRRPVDRRACDIRQTVEDNLEIFQERLARNRIKVETAFEQSCPLVHADPDQISQVLINLVMNAVHAMADGGTLRVGLASAQNMVKLTVADSGHGMPADVMQKIYDPFFTTKEFGKGTGLGLTVVKGIVEEHQGSIAVSSEPGNGTTFTILLPVHQAGSES